MLTAAEVARWLRVSPAWVRQHANGRRPELPAVRLGSLLRFRASDIQKFIEQWCRHVALPVVLVWAHLAVSRAEF
jgi:excisionase family DNA binding protein